MSAVTTPSTSRTAQEASGALGASPSADRAPTLARLVEVELRKAVDTRAGFWLLFATALLSCTVTVLRLVFGDRHDKTLDEVFTIAQAPVNALVPVIGILLVTSEWSQRGALTTFVLVPHRGRVIGAKLLAMIAADVAATAVALVAALAGFGVGTAFGATAGGWHLPAAMIAQTFLAQVLTMLMGAAFGLLLLNSAAAIVLYFVLPTVWSILGSLISGLRTPAHWLDTGYTTGLLLTPDSVTAEQWAQVGTSFAVWLLLPMAVGMWRLRRKEIA